LDQCPTSRPALRRILSERPCPARHTPSKGTVFWDCSCLPLVVALAAGQHHPTHSLANHHLFHLLAQHRHMLAQFVEVPQDRFKLELGVDVVVWLVVHDAPWAFNSRHCCDARTYLSAASSSCGAFSYRAAVRSLIVPLALI